MAQPDYRQEIINRIEVPVEQREVTAESVKTAYLSAGSGPPVVCLHGSGAGAVTWYPSISALAEHFRVVAGFLFGTGDSESACYWAITRRRHLLAIFLRESRDG